MEAQSSALAYGFGIDYEYGKRTIKSMSNETFNALTSVDVSNLIKEHNQVVLDRLREMLPNYQGIMTDIIEQQVQVELKKAERTPSAMAEIITALASGTSQTIKDALGVYAETEQDKSTMYQTLSLISPMVSLLALMEQSGSTTTPPNTSTGNLKKWTSKESTQAGTYCAHWSVMRDYSYDKNKAQELLDLKSAKLIQLSDKYGGKWINTYPKDPNADIPKDFCYYGTTDPIEAQDAATFFNTSDEYWLIKTENNL